MAQGEPGQHYVERCRAERQLGDIRAGPCDARAVQPALRHGQHLEGDVHPDDGGSCLDCQTCQVTRPGSGVEDPVPRPQARSGDGLLLPAVMKSTAQHGVRQIVPPGNRGKSGRGVVGGAARGRSVHTMSIRGPLSGVIHPARGPRDLLKRRSGGFRDWLVLAVFVLVCLGAGAVGSLFTTPALDGWYATLRKPPWNPPNWVFAPVWSALYLMMAVAAWLVWGPAGFGGGPARLGSFRA